MQDAWTACKTEAIQGYSESNEWNNSFFAINTVYNPTPKEFTPLLSADGITLLNEKTQILQRCAKHFRGALKRRSTISEAAIASLPKAETNADFYLPPSLHKTIKAVKQLTRGHTQQTHAGITSSHADSGLQMRNPRSKQPLLAATSHRRFRSLCNAVAQRLENLPIAATAAAASENASVEHRWCQLRDTVRSTALAVFGRARRQHQDWFDDNDAIIINLLVEKDRRRDYSQIRGESQCCDTGIQPDRLHKPCVDHPTDANKAAFYRSHRHLQQRVREMQDAWTARKAEEIQGYADRNEWKNFFSAIRAVYGPPTKGTAPLLSVDGSTLLTEKTQILQRWAEHLRGVLNRPTAISDAAIDRLPQVETNVDIDLPPSLQETIRAVQQLPSAKAPGSDAIPAEVYKQGGPQLMDHLTALFQETQPTCISKRKGNRQICDNHRGIFLLNIAGKIFARILPNRLNNRLEQGLLPESQCGFRHHRRTTDMIFAARQLQEKCQEMRTHLYSTFVGLTKDFDTVNREGLWKIMQKFGCPERFIQMVRQLHDGMMARVTDNGAVSEAFAVTNGVKQGCVLAPTLFSLMFSAVLMGVYRDERRKIRIAEH
ncbi:hypothetical protein SprV_0401404700 [Sparganum proliferum]